MALELVKLDSETLPGIADAIRAKTGGTALLRPSEMAAAIAGIPTGGSLPALTTPAAESDVLAGKEYIDGSGAKKAGTLVVCDSVNDDAWPLAEPGVGLWVGIESSVDQSRKNLSLLEPNLLPENIKSGVSIFKVAGSAKTLRVETGTITPAEDTVSLTLPEPYDGVKALEVSAVNQTELETKGADSIYSFRSIITYATKDSTGILIRYTGSAYRATTSAFAADGNGKLYIVGSTGRYFRAGIAYNYYVYYWEDDA